MFTMLALLTPGAPEIPIEYLAEKVQALFGGNKNFRYEYEVLPFKKNRNLMLHWSGWSMRLFCETGETVRADAAEITRILGNKTPPGVAESTRRIRALFEDDPEERYIDEMVEVTAMLKDMEGVVVFDPQQNDIVA